MYLTCSSQPVLFSCSVYKKVSGNNFNNFILCPSPANFLVQSAISSSPILFLVQKSVIFVQIKEAIFVSIYRSTNSRLYFENIAWSGIVM